MELSLLADVARVSHRDVGLRLAELPVVGVESLVAVVKQVAFRVVQSWIRLVVQVAVPEKDKGHFETQNQSF